MSTDDTEWTPKGPSPWPWVIGVIVVVAGAAFAFTTMRASAKKREAAEHAAAVQRTADSLTAAARAESLAALADTAKVDSTIASAKPTTTPRPAATPPKPAPSTATAATKPAATKPAGEVAKPEGGPYGIAVGSPYMFDDKANATKDDLASKTGLAGRVRTVKDGGTDMFQVVLGSFPTKAAAQAKADELTGSGAVEQARVVPLPK